MNGIGTVYVFNTTAQTLNVLLNNQSFTNMKGVDPSNGYQPSSTTYPRNPAAGNPGTGQFGGVNSVEVAFQGGGSQSYSVTIDPNQVEINQDLQLYIFYGELVLVINSSGDTITFTAQS